MVFVGAILLLIAFALLVLVGVALMLPVTHQAMEQVRIEREASEASWRIHQQATRAFGQMLKAARDSDDPGQGP